MKLNHECVRELLLYIEENCKYPGHISITNIKLNEYGLADIAYTARKLAEAGYIKADFKIERLEALHATISGLTWEGHKFLDTIRDNTVWSHTKNVLSKLTSYSISLMSNVASQVLTNLINQQIAKNPTIPF